MVAAPGRGRLLGGLALVLSVRAHAQEPAPAEAPPPPSEPTAEPAAEPPTEPPAPTDTPAPALPGDTPAALVPPQLVSCPPLAYPPGLDRGAQRVDVVLLVDEQGAVETIEPVAGDEPFVSMVTGALPACRFVPAHEGGAPVAVEVPFSWEFPEPPVNVAGLVRESGSRRPVPELSLIVGNRSARTDATGRFELRNVPPGDYTVQPLDVSWRLLDGELRVVEGERLDVELYAARDREAQEAVGLYRVERTTVNRRSLSQDEIRTMPGTMGDPVRALQNTPGLLRAPFDAGWLLVRGGGPDDTGVFLDGVRVPLLFHLGGTTSVLHPEMVESVSLYPGAYPARYGGAIAGVVDMVPKTVEGDVQAVGGVNLVYSHAYAEAPLGDGGVAVAARRSYLDAVLALVLSPEQAKVAPRFWDWQLRWDTPKAGFMLVGMSDTIDAPTGDGSETVQVTQAAVQLQGRWQHDLVGGTLHVRPWFARQVRTLDVTGRTEAEQQWFPGLRAEYERRFAEIWDVTAGAEGEWRLYAIERDEVGREGTIAHADPYAQLAVGKDVRAEGGVRLETLFVTDQLPRTGLAPRGSLRWQARDDVAFVAEAGRFFRAPSSLYLLGMIDGEYLPLQRATVQSVGARYERARVGFDVDVFRRDMDDLALFEEDGTIGDQQGLAYGVETLTRVAVGHFDGRFMYQYVRTFRREEPGDGWTPYRYDTPHLVQAIGSYALPKQLTVSGRWRFASGYWLDPDVSTAYDILTLQTLYIVADDNGRLPPFHQLDLKVSKRFSFKAWRLDTFLDVQNVYARRAPEPVINGIDDTNPVYGYGPPFLPIFGVEAEFWP